MIESASFGGPNWVPRKFSHFEEMNIGSFWNSCGVNREWDPLKSVLLSWPQDSLDTKDLDTFLLIRNVDLNRLRNQTEKLALFYEDRGINVHLYHPKKIAPPNLIFMRDTFLMTPQGAVLGRLGGQARAGEEPFVAQALISNGIPIVHSIIGSGCFEGADALWINNKTVLIAKGFRTNDAGVQQTCKLLFDIGISSEIVTLPAGTQHLLGIVNFVDNCKAIVREELMTSEIRNILEKHEISVILLPSSKEVLHKRAMNFVTLKPNCIVMPSNCPLTRKFYEKHGIECYEIDVSEYINAGGALGCLTGIVKRSS